MRSTNNFRFAHVAILLSSLSTIVQAQPATTRPAIQYDTAAREVMEYMQANLYQPQTGLYFLSLEKREPDMMWGNGITFSALVAAARHDPETYGPLLSRFFKELDRHWDAKVKIPGYEPAPTRGNGNDKYYDDNQWMVLAFMEAYELTGEARYRDRALETLRFSLSGWDDELGGGIWWHEGHKDG
jgi:uncharacterized protein YyaL (SSP411 family)